MTGFGSKQPLDQYGYFYAIALQPTLFGEVSIIRNWGRIGTKGQLMLETFPSQGTAKRQADLIERQKQRRGYV